MMIHKGNIANITITPADVVDCVIGGSPCQGLSVAGKRLGLSDERSGLFMEQIRIIKEMREVDKRSGRSGINVRPRWGVWENVPGALSSGTPKGEDFRIVLEEFIKIADPTATVPRPARGGWNNSGCIVGDGYSLAWRIMDARYHGVPQRRRRITLIVDFAGDSASEVLFNEEGMRWDFETSQRAWKAIAQHFGNGAAGGCGCGLGADLYNMCLTGECAATLNANSCGSSNHAGPSVCQPIAFHMLQDPISSEVSPCLGGRDQCSVGVVLDNQGGNPVCNQGGNVVCHEVCAFTQNQREEVRELGEIAGSLSSQTGTHQKTYVVEAFMGGQGEKAGWLGYRDEETPTLKSTTSGSNVVPDVVYAIDGNVCDRVSKKNGCGYSEDVSPTLNTQDRHAVVYDARGNGDGHTAPTLTSDHARTVSDYTPLVCTIDGRICVMNEELSGTLQSKSNGGQSLNCINPVLYEESGFSYYREGCGTLKAKGGSIGPGSESLVCEVYPSQTGSLCANSHPGSYTGQDAYNDMLPVIKQEQRYIVRRLTPTECSRLQGLPDDWCNPPPEIVESDKAGWVKSALNKILKLVFKKVDCSSNIASKSDVDWWKPICDEWAKIKGKQPKSELQIAKWLTTPISESAQYQMYGNGIALPQWVWTLGRIIETYGEHKPTMASLFDGTGSFPLIWNSILGGAYTVWSSEVNPDAVRVSKYRMQERGW